MRISKHQPDPYDIVVERVFEPGPHLGKYRATCRRMAIVCHGQSETEAYMLAKERLRHMLFEQIHRPDRYGFENGQ